MCVSIKQSNDATFTNESLVFDLISEMGFQKGLELFVMQFDSFVQFTYTLSCFQWFLTLYQ